MMHTQLFSVCKNNVDYVSSENITVLEAKTEEEYYSALFLFHFYCLGSTRTCLIECNLKYCCSVLVINEDTKVHTVVVKNLIICTSRLPQCLYILLLNAF